MLKDGGNEDSTEETDWIRYTDPSSVHFTNRDLTDEAGASAQNIIYLDSTKRNVLRLVYDTKEADFTTPATFYDYNISSGQNADGKWRTGITGINSESNYGTDYRAYYYDSDSSARTAEAHYSEQYSSYQQTSYGHRHDRVV